ncbi:MAG: MFS transporter [Candidatus Methanoperedens sp.]|nr:MFS transporter [Candidatus Methanoperedens sp.]
MEQSKNEKLFTKNFILTSLSTFTLFTSFYFLLITLPFYIQKLGGSESEIGYIIGVFTISAVFLRPFIGREVDKHGRKKLLVAGMVVFLISMMLYNYTTDVTSLLLLRILHGIGWGAATTAASTLIADIAPPARRGEAMGIFGMSSNVAMAIGPVLSMILLKEYDFPVLFSVCAAIALISLLLVLPISEKIVIRPKTPLFSKEALFPSVLMFTISLTYGSIVSFLPLFQEKQGVSNAGIFFSVFAITLILVRALAGKLSDIKGRKFVIVPGMIIISLGLFFVATASSLTTFLVAALLYGLGFGLFHPTLMALLVDRVSPQGRGAAMGTFTAAFDLGIGVGSIIMGIVLQFAGVVLKEKFGEFAGFSAIYILGGLIVLAAAVLFTLKYNENKRDA